MHCSTDVSEADFVHAIQIKTAQEPPNPTNGEDDQAAAAERAAKDYFFVLFWGGLGFMNTFLPVTPPHPGHAQHSHHSLGKGNPSEGALMEFRAAALGHLVPPGLQSALLPGWENKHLFIFLERNAVSWSPLWSASQPRDHLPGGTDRDMEEQGSGKPTPTPHCTLPSHTAG